MSERKRSPVVSLDEAMDRALRDAPEAFPTIPYEPGDGDRNVTSLRDMAKAATGRSNKGPLPDEQEPDVVTEMEQALSWATRDVPEDM